MTTVLCTTLAATLFIASLIAHEAAHALALRGFGIPIVQAGLGISLPPRLTFKATPRKPFKLVVSPWLLGAYVMPHPDYQEQIDGLRYRDAAWFAGAGIAANIVIGCGLFAALDLFEGRFVWAAGYGAAAVLTWVARRPLVAYVMPVLGVAVVGFVAYLLATTVGQDQGPIGIAKVLVVSSPTMALVAAAAGSLALGTLNLLPLFPFDGGRLWDLILRQWAGPRVVNAFRGAGLVCALALTAYSFGADVVNLILGR